MIFCHGMLFFNSIKANDCLFLTSYRLLINNKKYFVRPPPREKVTSEELTRLGDVKALVSQVRYAMKILFYSTTLPKCLCHLKITYTLKKIIPKM